MRCAKKVISGPIAVVATGIGVLPLRCFGSLLKIHFVAAIPAEQQPGKQVDFLRFRGPVLGGNPLLGKFKGFLVNQRFMGIWEPCIDEKDTAQKQKNKITYFMQKRNIEAGKKIKKLAFSKRSPVSKKLRTRDAKSTFYRWSKLAIRLSPK